MADEASRRRGLHGPRKTDTCFDFRNEAEIGLTVHSEKGRLVSLVRYLDQARRGKRRGCHADRITCA